MGPDAIGYFIIVIIVIVIVFLITREFWTWYFKISERVKLMENQTEVLDKILETLNPELVKRERKEADKVKDEKDKEDEKDINDSDISNLMGD